MTLPDPRPDSGTVHVRLLAGRAPSGKPVFEVLPAYPLEAGRCELAGSPGLVLGCAAGDVLDVGEDGGFEVVRQGGNLCVQAYRPGGFAPGAFADLRNVVGGLGGSAEAPADLRFIVVTVGRTGAADTEAAMDAWAASTDGASWWFGNA
ncbi:DUF4265 domain-containing protein [Kitasatospora sp. NPDC097605]|uniref:DUF4265 domain-containing protein n=1 Tax=Kitasatospora sp. NPDC097605 TaxID=3157226 RepID=UPI0033282FD7